MRKTKTKINNIFQRRNMFSAGLRWSAFIRCVSGPVAALKTSAQKRQLPGHRFVAECVHVADCAAERSSVPASGQPELHRLDPGLRHHHTGPVPVGAHSFDGTGCAVQWTRLHAHHPHVHQLQQPGLLPVGQPAHWGHQHVGAHFVRGAHRQPAGRQHLHVPHHFYHL